MTWSWKRGCMVSGICLLAACSREPTTAPPPTLHSITGHLRLTGYFVDSSGAFAGTRVVGDPDGVTVELLHGPNVVATTTTVQGVYRFTGLREGGYVARSRVVGNIGDETSPMTIAIVDVVAADTLRLASRGDLYPIPNPFGDTTQVFFTVPDTMQVEVNILDIGGNRIKNLLSLELLPARHAIFWNGTNTQGHQVPGTMFWITYAAEADFRAHLLFRPGASPN